MNSTPLVLFVELYGSSTQEQGVDEVSSRAVTG